MDLESYHMEGLELVKRLAKNYNPPLRAKLLMQLLLRKSCCNYQKKEWFKYRLVADMLHVLLIKESSLHGDSTSMSSWD